MLFLPRGSIKQIIEADIAKRNSPRLFVFFGLQNNQDGTVGMAYIGTLCASQNQVFYRASINEYFVDDITTAEIVAHEIGKCSPVSFRDPVQYHCYITDYICFLIHTLFSEYFRKRSIF